MSTKIYTGIKFHATDIFELQEQLQDLGVRARKRAVELIFEFMERGVKEGHELTYDNGARLLDIFCEDYRENHAGRGGMVDCDLEIVVYPRNGVFYGQYFASFRPLEAWLKEQDLFEDFGYWNNTDEPEDVSWEDWCIRGEIWDKILEHSSVPAEAGLTVKLVSGDRALWDARWDLKEYLESKEAA